MPHEEVKRLPIEPRFRHEKSRAHFLMRARAIEAAQKNASDAKAALDVERRAFVESRKAVDVSDEAALRSAVLVLIDLARQGWRVHVKGKRVEISQPPRGVLHLEEKERVRAQLHVERDEQLNNEPVRAFVRSMETRRVYGDRWVSIFSLMRDGADLARRLDELRGGAAGELRARALRVAIRPYLQFVTDTNTCERTGYRLLDVWRYFRYTWASPYRSVPGRSMMVLIRDAAVEPHPVIGIAAISSAAVQIGARDRAIGWLPEQIIENLEREPSEEMAGWIQRIVDGSLKEIFVDDFIEDGTLSLADLKSPTPDALARLAREAMEQRDAHKRSASAAEHKVGVSGDKRRSAEDWRREARTPLFRSKRADALGTLLTARREIRKHSGRRLTLDGLKSLLQDADGQRIMRKLIKRAKAERVGTAMADITVCGAIAPYNALLGGKLVSMMLASPEVTGAYRERYAQAKSVIASSIAGRPIVRSAELVFLGTTSLYGIGSSQYNRLKMPCSAAGGSPDEAIQYKQLGNTMGYGTLQFGADTVKSLATLVAQEKNGERVNSIFGEGVNPRLRKARAGLDQLGLDSQELLNHGSPRVVYGVELARNFREYLLGMEEEADFLLPNDDASGRTKDIVDWWIDRWLGKRIERDDVIAEVARHRLVNPVRHGARVAMPTQDTDQLRFFDE